MTASRSQSLLWLKPPMGRRSPCLSPATRPMRRIDSRAAASTRPMSSQLYVDKSKPCRDNLVPNGYLATRLEGVSLRSASEPTMKTL